MNLLVTVLQQQIADLAKEKGLDGARVLWKTNARGEMVVALLIPPRYPGEWKEPATTPREEKRRERIKRG